MTDFATINDAAGAFGLGFDWAVSNFDLQSDAGLLTAVFISLFSNRVAAADDELPDNSGDRQGWWGDMPLDGGAPDPIGSRLWLLARAKHTPQTATRAAGYAAEGLAWMQADGVADEIDTSASWIDGETLKLSVAIKRQVAGKPVNHRWDFVWNPAKSAAPAVVQQPPLLGVGDGTVLGTEDGAAFSLF